MNGQNGEIFTYPDVIVWISDPLFPLLDSFTLDFLILYNLQILYKKIIMME